MNINKVYYFNWVFKPVSYLQVAVFAAALFATNISIAAAPDKYQLGVFPHMSSTHVERKFAPVAHALSELLNKPVRLGTATDIKKFQKRVLKGDFDVAMIPPLAIVPVVDKGGYIPLARRESTAASVVVLNDSTLKSIDDLKGKSLGLPAGTPVNIILRLTLEDKGFIKNKNIHFKTFNTVQACLHKLLLKKIDACGTASGTAINMFEKKMGARVRNIMDTEPFPHMLLVANPKMTVNERELLTRAILGKDNSEKGQALMNALGKNPKFIEYRKEDYDIIRSFMQRWIKYDQDSL